MPIDKSEVVRLYHQGKNDAQIAEKLRCSREYIRQVRNIYNLPVQPVAKKLDLLSSKERKDIERKLLSLVPISQVAAEYNISSHLLYTGFSDIIKLLPEKKRQARLKNIADYWEGHQVGMLSVEKVVYGSVQSTYLVDCVCSCGRHKTVTLNNLRSGQVFSCAKGGCMASAKANAKDYRRALQEVMAGEPRDPETRRVQVLTS